jgi:steroid delta-isomerase-like uncharacterized protein
MSNDNKALMRRVYDEVINGGNVVLIDELVAANFVEHEEFPGLAGGREGMKQFFVMMRTAFPDLRMAVDDLIAEGDKVVARTTMSGTHKGEFMGMDPSGKQFRVSAIDVIRFADGKAIEHWGLTDAAAMMEQLGAIPAASS